MSELWRIVIGSDDGGLAYKQALTADLRADPRVAEVIDVAAWTDQLTPHVGVASAATRVVTQGRADRALLICGAGLGVAMSANKVAGIRAVIAFDSSSVQRSVVENDAQVLCFGHRVISLDVARRLASEWLGYRFECGSSTNVIVIGRDGDNSHPGHRHRSRLNRPAFQRPVVACGRPVDAHGSERGGRLRVLPAVTG